MRRIKDQVRLRCDAPPMIAEDSRGRRGGSLAWRLLPPLVIVAGAAWWLFGPSHRDTPLPSLPTTSSTSPREPVVPASPRAEGTPPHQPRRAGERKLKNAKVAAAPVSHTKLQQLAPEKPVPAAAPAPLNELPAEVDKLLVGEWSGYYQGERQLTVAADGTGTMVAQPEGLAATLLAPKLTFQIKWKRKKELLEFETLGGEPVDKVNIVVKMYGRKRAHKILDVQKHQFELLDEDGVTKYLWKRSDHQPPATSTDSKAGNTSK